LCQARRTGISSGIFREVATVKILVVGDVHLSRKRLKRSKDLLKRVSGVIEARPELEAVVLLGDVFDTHDIQDNDCLTIYSDFVMRNEERIKIHHVVGNHEMNDSKTYLPTVHALNPWKGRENVFIHDQPVSIAMGTARVGFIPYVPNGMFGQALASLDENEPQIVFAHQEFVGCEMGSQASDTGDEIPRVKIVSGHIHGEQRIGNVWYPGTPCQHNFAESEEKFVYVLEIQDGEYRIAEKIDLGLPRLKTVKTSAQEYPVIDAEDGNLYRIVVRDTPENIVMYKKSDYYREMHKSVKFKFDVVKSAAERVEIEKHLSFEQRLLELVEQEGLKPTYEAIFKEFPSPPVP